MITSGLLQVVARGQIAHQTLFKFFSGLPKRLGSDTVQPERVEEALEFLHECLTEAVAGQVGSRLDLTEFIDDNIPMPAAVSMKQLKVRSLMWPCPERLDPGTPVLYADKFATPSGKALMSVAKAAAARPTQEPAEGVLMATLGLPLFPFRTGTLSRHSYALSRVEPDPRLHLNTNDASRMGIGDQVPVQVTMEGADASDPIYAVSLVYDRVPEGSAFLAITLEQAGTNRGIREARQIIQSGDRKAVPIRVQLAPHMAPKPAGELQPAATRNVLDSGVQPL